MPFPRSTALLAALIALAPLGSGAARAEDPQVRTTKPEAGGPRETFRLPVIAEPETLARLYARANGFVAERRVDIGDAVKAGDVLAVIDAPEIVRNHERAKAAVGQADARVALADANLKRTAALAGKDFASEAALDDRKAQSDVAVADREAALAELRRFEELLAFRQVRAPFDGIVTARNVELGDLVVGDQASNATPMFELARTVRLRVVADVPQSALASVRLGETVAVTFDRFAGEAFSATVSRMSGAIDRRSGTMRVEMTMENQDARVPAGLAGSAEFARGAERSVRVPTSAVTIRDGKPMVATLRQGAIEFRYVELGRHLGRTQEIRKGLSETDEVVLNPNGMLRHGDRASAAGAS